MWKGIINGLIRIINNNTIKIAKNGLINLRHKGCNLKIYHICIDLINPKKVIEGNVAIAAPIPLYKGIR